MDYFDLFLIALLVGAVLFFLPGIISARQSKKEKQLEALEKQTEEENAGPCWKSTASWTMRMIPGLTNKYLYIFAAVAVT